MEGGMWWTLIGVIVALVAGGAILYVVSGGLSTQKENIALLSSCKNQGGDCLKDCPAGYTGFYKYGCPGDKDPKENEWCCIPKEKPEEKKAIA